MTYDKTTFLQLRPFLLSGQLSESAINFLHLWCEDEGRPSEKLLLILNILNGRGVALDFLRAVVNHLDLKFAITKLIHTKSNQVIKVW